MAGSRWYSLAVFRRKARHTLKSRECLRPIRSRLCSLILIGASPLAREKQAGRIGGPAKDKASSPASLICKRLFMSATDSAIQVIQWALLGSGPPPRGDLYDTDALARPDQPLQAALAQLAGVTAARLHLGFPPLGDPSPVGVGSAVLAAALGALHTPSLARTLLGAVPPASTPVEWITRHGLLARALPFLFRGQDHPLAPLAEDGLLVSSLTALLTYPAEGQQGMLLDLAQRLLRHPAGRRLLALSLAQPTGELAVRRWRHDLLERLRPAGDKGMDFVLDVYEAAMIYHAQETLDQVQAARRVITDSAAAADEQRLRDALAVAAWWESLWAVERSHPEALRGRRYLGYRYREGIALFQLAQRLTGGRLL